MIEISKHPTKNGVFQLKTELLISRPRDEVFEFFADSVNLERITPKILCFKIVTPQPIEIRKGALIDYKLKLHGIPIRWRTEITNWQPPVEFSDTQLKGPYRKWVHLHTFEETEDGTLMKDQVDYSVYGGALIERLFVRPDLKKIFTYRNDYIANYFFD